MMSHLIPINSPIRLQCFSVPVNWRIENEAAKDKSHVHEYLCAEMTSGKVGTYDPWEKRNELFRLREGDTQGLLNFLQSVGLWNRPDPTDFDGEPARIDFEAEGGTFIAYEQFDRPLEDFWWVRESAEVLLLPDAAKLKELRESQPVGSNYAGMLEGWDEAARAFIGRDLPARFVSAKKTGSYLLLNTTTFVDALLASVMIDRALRHKAKKCARKDCGVLFTTDNQHKRKYCSWYCGHLVAVRKSRIPKATQAKQK